MKSNVIWVIAIVTAAWLGVEFAANNYGDWIFYMAGAVIVGLLVWTQYQIKHQKDMISLLSDKCDPEAFLQVYEAELGKVKDPGQLDILRINQAAGVCYTGDFERALKIINSIDFDNLKGIYKAHFVNNKVSILILAGRDKEAIRVAERNREYLEMTVKNVELETAIRGTLGGISFLKGDRVTARKQYEALLEKSPAPLIDATSHFFLGRINRDEQRWDASREHFNKAIEMGGNTVISKLSAKELSEIEGSR